MSSSLHSAQQRFAAFWCRYRHALLLVCLLHYTAASYHKTVFRHHHHHTILCAAGIVSEVADAVALPKFSADGKALVVLWLDGAVHAGATDTCVPDCLRVVAVCAADKAAEVRDAAGKLVASLAAQYPMSDIASAMASLDAAQKKAANEAFAKAGPGIATASMAKPLATGAAGAPKAAAPGASRPPTAPKAANAAALNTAPSATISRAGSNASSIGASAAGSAKPSHARSSSQGSLMMDASEEPLLQVDNKKEARAQKVSESSHLRRCPGSPGVPHHDTLSAYG